MLSIKWIKCVVPGLLLVIAACAYENNVAKDAPVNRASDSDFYPRHILTRIEIDMKRKAVQILLGRPDSRSNFAPSPMTYGRLQIIFSEEKRVQEIQYRGRCGVVPLKKRDFNILYNPGGLKPLVIEALSRNDLLCPGHAFERRITECIAEVMGYIDGT